jgi:hypothetical protein
MKDDDVHCRIAERAYTYFIDRGDGHGRDLEDWFRAEKEILAEIEREEVSETARKSKPPGGRKSSTSSKGRRKRR